MAPIFLLFSLTYSEFQIDLIVVGELKLFMFKTVWVNPYSDPLCLLNTDKPIDDGQCGQNLYSTP